ncbi:uncharacterized protein B0H18DRAFT_872405, partial [Fomitopsis serialis]|uniref:uncharacterized protein n=1 Tax=Fomitopsis serialis TaxID=139415 RepID=UPI002007DD85
MELPVFDSGSSFAAGQKADARDDNPIRHKHVWAIVVGIDDYAHPEAVTLRGAADDSDNFHQFLTNTLDVPSGHVVRLNDKEATRTRILGEFFSHLIHNPAIERGDMIVFFYAGHGDCKNAPASWNAGGQFSTMAELICPHDQGMQDQEGKTIFGIPSRTFGALMRQLAHVKGDNILAVFDCYHPG